MSDRNEPAITNEIISEYERGLANEPSVAGVREHRTTAVELHRPPQGCSLIACPGNIDSSTQRGKALLLKARGPGDIAITAEKPARIVATHWLLIPEQRVDEKTGEISEFVSLVFLDQQGRSLKTTAAHAVHTVRAMLDLYTPAEWSAGIPIVITPRLGKRKTIWHDIQIDMETMP